MNKAFIYILHTVDNLVTIKQLCSLCLNFFRLVLAREPNLEKIIFIQTNSFIIFTCPNPVLLVPGFGQVG